ncbi:hypothetical protein MLD38_024020 [Melastoma candidum]|uniref:Uncharacterized protein n=1 Tax=Melastoma candidum TaxID=119954 RepID=A0ACB9NTZ2_9MYRT|nr:hypothetical protein MLD38_024020 [Melastoma candidum]
MGIKDLLSLLLWVCRAGSLRVVDWSFCLWGSSLGGGKRAAIWPWRNAKEGMSKLAQNSFRQHWSLANICFPDREDQSGPIVLHLDSLQLHCSKLISHNIKGAPSRIVSGGGS